MTQGLLRGDRGEIPGPGFAERATRTGEDQALHGGGILPLQALEDGVVLAVDGKDAATGTGGGRHHLLAGHDKDLLAGDGEILSGCKGGERGLESGRADDGDKDQVGTGMGGEGFQSLSTVMDRPAERGRETGGRLLGPGADNSLREFPTQFQEAVGIPPGDAGDRDPSGKGPRDPEGTLADGARGPQ